MRKNTLVSALTAAALLAGASLAAPAALAQDGMAAPQDMPLPSRQYVIDLGVGALVKPKYEGADKMMVSPLPIISFGRFYLPGLGQVSDGEKTTRGVFFFPSINFVGERKASDSVKLTGTDKVDWALELGLGAGFRYDWFSAFVELRQGINGHSGQVGQVGADVILNPMERLEIAFGPRADFASGDYMGTYFGVTAAEAAASLGNLTAYKASGGFKSVGLSGRASYAVTDQTALHLQAGWDRYIGDARNSPIVRRGNENQFSIGAGVTYRFSFDLF
ncbi:MipA/OmpV family protein [Stappia sp. WLB 29]|uniref:MipA/OmpV family protein n=1 Tax=Stappia sp. WLB 29 TaxID=2925220 RepID=UPI0020BF4267|nr:MipA/OmpV family protein [Stappia sp. WLB 29]